MGPSNQRSDKSNLGVVAGLLGHALEAREQLQVLLRHCYMALVAKLPSPDESELTQRLP